jgi:hypothetical protein
MDGQTASSALQAIQVVVAAAPSLVVRKERGKELAALTDEELWLAMP